MGHSFPYGGIQSMDKDLLLKMAKRVFPKPAQGRDEVAAAAAGMQGAGSLDAPGLESLKPPGAPPAAAAPAGLEAMELPGEAEVFGLPPANVVEKRLRDGGSAL